MKARATVILLSCLLAMSCSGNRRVEVSGSEEALERATKLVSGLNETFRTEHTLTAAASNGVPVVSITVGSAGSDYLPTVERILETTKSFKGELQISVETPMPVSDSEAASGVKDARFILARFNGKTGERIP